MKYKCNWEGFLKDMQLIFLAVLFLNIMNAAINYNGKFILTIGLVISGLAFIALILYSRNLEASKK